MRSVTVVTTSRADYGIYRPILRRLSEDDSFGLSLIVGGTHLRADFGSSVQQIEADGFPIGARVDMLLDSDAPEAVAVAMGRATAGYAEVLVRDRPDILMVLGDRFEMHAAAVAALPFLVPVAHVHGGEVTHGAFDDSLRHSITKLSHLHFVSTKEHARRVVQLGEEPWRVTVAGAPSLDNIAETPLLPKEELARVLGLPLEPAPLLVTFHPVTLESEHTARQVDELLAALDQVSRPVVLTAPNADPGGREVRCRLEAFVQQRENARLVENLGTQAYFSTMAHAAAMVGNSSSGIIEAASFALPVVNVGTRQQGRPRGANVVDVGYQRDEIADAILRVLTSGFRASLSGIGNVYGEGRAAEVIATRLRDVPLGRALVQKRFRDIALTPGRPG